MQFCFIFYPDRGANIAIVNTSIVQQSRQLVKKYIIFPAFSADIKANKSEPPLISAAVYNLIYYSC